MTKSLAKSKRTRTRGLKTYIATADEARVGRAGVVATEGGILVGGALSGLDVDEAQATGVIGGVEVNAALVVRDVEALDDGALVEVAVGGIGALDGEVERRRARGSDEGEDVLELHDV